MNNVSIFGLGKVGHTLATCLGPPATRLSVAIPSARLSTPSMLAGMPRLNPASPSG